MGRDASLFGLFLAAIAGNPATWSASATIIPPTPDNAYSRRTDPKIAVMPQDIGDSSGGFLRAKVTYMVGGPQIIQPVLVIVDNGRPQGLRPKNQELSPMS
ncbi:hypothetical protein BH09ACT10_BH09ACT10_02320 [soil metagenome]